MAETQKNKRVIDGMTRTQTTPPTNTKKTEVKVAATQPAKAQFATKPEDAPKPQKNTPAPAVSDAAASKVEPSAIQTSVKSPDKGQPPITGWSWGAFLLSWIWGIGNHVWIALLVLIPIAPINLIVAIYLGIKGNELAWRKKTWESPEQFIEVQKKWAKWGLIVLILVVILTIGVGVLVAMSASSNISTQ